MDFDLHNACQSHIFYKSLKCSHGHSGHFAPAGLIGNPDTSSVFDTSVEKQIFQKSGAQFGVYIRRFNTVSAAISMPIRSGLD